MEDFRFVFQENQFWGKCVPCTPAVFNKRVDDPKVARKIELRRAVDKAIQEGLSLDSFTQEREFMQFCSKKQGEKNFATLTTAEKLLQWTNMLKMFYQKHDRDFPISHKKRPPYVNVRWALSL